jgi:hypothetical protein
MKRACVTAIAAVLLVSTAARADQTTQYFGVVESYEGVGGKIVIRTTKNSVGHWDVDKKTLVKNAIKVNDWVTVWVIPSGHVVTLLSEQHAEPRAGVIKQINKDGLSIASGTSTLKWTVTSATGFEGVARADLKVGDNIGFNGYENNHYLATVKLIKHAD